MSDLAICYQNQSHLFAFSDSPDGSLENCLFSQLTDEMDSVALEWKTLRNVYECICSTPFDHFSRKVCVVYIIVISTDLLINIFCV